MIYSEIEEETKWCLLLWVVWFVNMRPGSFLAIVFIWGSNSENAAKSAKGEDVRITQKGCNDKITLETCLSSSSFSYKPQNLRWIQRQERQFELVTLLLITKGILRGNWGKVWCYNIPRNVKLAEDVGPKATGSPIQ